MGLGLNLKVNRLPARTWNWLDMNEASLKQIEAGDEHTVITEGIAKEVTGIPKGELPLTFRNGIFGIGWAFIYLDRKSVV